MENWRARLLAPLAAQPAAVLATLVAVVAMLHAWSQARRHAGLDFYHLWAGAKAIREGLVADLYAPENREVVLRRFFVKPEKTARRTGLRVQQLFYPRASPLAFALTGLFSRNDFERDQYAYQIVALAAYAIAIIALCHVLRYPPVAAAMMIAVLLPWFDPALSDARIGNVSRFQLALVAGYVGLAATAGSSRARAVMAGALLGFAVLFKPNVALVVAAIVASRLLNRRAGLLVRELAGAAIGAAAAFVIASLYFGTPACWLSWMRHLPGLHAGAQDLIWQGNISPTNALWEAFGWNLEIPMLLACATLGGAALWWQRRANGDTANETVFAVGIGCAIPLFAARLAWLHYFVLAAPLIVFALRPRGEARALPLVLTHVACAIGVVLLARVPLAWMGLRLSDVQSTWVTIAGTALVAGTACASLSESATAPPLPSPPASEA